MQHGVTAHQTRSEERDISHAVSESVHNEGNKSSVKQPNQNKPNAPDSVWGTFHFIAKSDSSLLTNTRLPLRAVSPVVDTLHIPEDIFIYITH